MGVTRAVVGILAMMGIWAGGGAWAGEHMIGQPVEINGLKVESAFLQAVTMDPQDEMCGPVEADIHLTALIHALPGNRNGFAAGEWIPNLTVSFELTRRGSPYKATGVLVPMVAEGGPHYGKNLKLDGPGKYHLAITVQPPQLTGFFRHVDKETGVAGWWEPFKEEWDFVFVGSPGKKGGY
ncbi:MAG TPA: iron transporter [Candidatus Sulfotelmatobacter sp.]|jgi:uncharacterized protein involved in high-affinity Fe2+ transport|nr:iron transporter [Candidatus Sulfotelmatobacter sp.]